MLRSYQVRAAGLSNTLYTTGDQMGTEMVFALGDVTSNSTGYIVGARISDLEDEVTATDLLIFTAPATPAADNAAASFADADADRLVGAISVSTIQDLALNKIAVWDAPGNGMPFVAPTGRLYVNMVARGAPPGYSSATALLVTLLIEEPR